MLVAATGLGFFLDRLDLLADPHGAADPLGSKSALTETIIDAHLDIFGSR